LSCKLEWIHELYSPFVPITAAIGGPEDYLKLVDKHEKYSKNNSFIYIAGLHRDNQIWSVQLFWTAPTTIRKQ
jgi:hypothetical protein